VCDLETKGAPSIFKKVIRSAAALARMFPILDLKEEDVQQEWIAFRDERKEKNVNLDFSFLPSVFSFFLTNVV
jgi:hypothetical protein